MFRWFAAIGTPRLLLFGGVLVCALAAFVLGLQAQWDLLNYHLYNPHALLNGRLRLDLAPAQMQTYLNPLFHVPFYLVFRYLHPDLMTLLSGALQGLSLYLLWRLLNLLLAAHGVPQWAVILLAVLGICGPIFLNELGALQGDATLGVLVLAGLLLVLESSREGGTASAGRNALIAGVLLGIATALKLTLAIYALGLGLALLICVPGRGRWGAVSAFGAGGALGLLLAGGAWFAYLWYQFGNPTFPYFNQVFQSSWVPESGWRDLRYLPVTWGDWLAYPWQWLKDPHRVWELDFRDLRVVALYPVVIAFLLLGWRRAQREAPALLLVCVFLGVSYALWLGMFSIYRYLSVHEMLAPGLLLSLWMFAGWWRGRRGLLAALLLIAASQGFVEFKRQERLVGFRPGQASALATLPSNAMVVIAGLEPVSFAILWLDDRIPVVRVRANFMNHDPHTSRLRLEAERRVREHPGPVFLLHAISELAAPTLAADLSRLGLHWIGSEICKPVFDDMELQQQAGVVICQLPRAPLQIAQHAD